MMRVLIFGLCVLLLFGHTDGVAVQPIATDSRIKTFVYNENDVYSLLTHYGYQSNVEFGKGETVRTVSVGDRIGWQVVPAGRRLFIKAMEENAHTNMTVVTNRRAYQFDLRSSGRVPLHPSEELVYVVRFFYPEEQRSELSPSQAPVPASMVSAAPIDAPVAAPVQPVAEAAIPAVDPSALNYNYTLSGPESIAPVRIYDDGQSTFFTFRADMTAPVQLFAVLPDGSLQQIPSSRNARGELVVPSVAPRFAVKSAGERVIVFNENMPMI